MTLVLDLSSYDLETWFAAGMKEQGVTAAIVGVYSPRNAPTTMALAADKLRDAGINVIGFYALIYFGSPFGETRDTLWAIDLAKRAGVDRVWLDCETDGRPNGFTDAAVPTPADRVAAIRKCVALVEAAGLKPGIYTGGWWWPASTGNSSEFAHLPLWHAAYFSSLEPVREVNYGGWTDVAIHQFTSSLPIAGRHRDANYVFMEEEDDMTPSEVVDIQAGQFLELLAQAVGAKESTFSDHALQEAIRTRLAELSGGSSGIVSGDPVIIDGIIR